MSLVTTTLEPPSHTGQAVILKLQAIQETFEESTQPKTLQQRTEQLVQQMVQAEVFSEATKGKILQWHTQFQQNPLPNLANEGGGVDASLALCYLLIGAIRKAVPLQEGNNTNENLLLDYEDKIRDLLTFTLPHGVDPDLFIETYEKLFEEEKTVEEKLNVIQQCFQQQVTILTENANAVNKQLQDTFEMLKSRLCELNTNRQRMNMGMQQRLNILTARVEHVSQLLNNVVAEIAGTSKYLDKKHHLYVQLIDECRGVIT